jgi:hypothetical protein
MAGRLAEGASVRICRMILSKSFLYNIRRLLGVFGFHGPAFTHLPKHCGLDEGWLILPEKLENVMI